MSPFELQCLLEQAMAPRTEAQRKFEERRWAKNRKAREKRAARKLAISGPPGNFSSTAVVVSDKRHQPTTGVKTMTTKEVTPVRNLFKSAFDLEVEQLRAVVENPDSSELEVRLAAERLDVLCPKWDAVSVQDLPPAALVHGEYSYHFSGSKKRIEYRIEPHMIYGYIPSIDTNSYKVLSAEVVILHKSGHSSKRRITATANRTSYVDCRRGQTKTAAKQRKALDRAGLMATFPQADVAEQVMDLLETELALAAEAKR